MKFELLAVQASRRPRYQLPSLLVINNNFGRILYRLRDIDASIPKIACFSTPPLFDALAQAEPVRISSG